MTDVKISRFTDGQFKGRLESRAALRLTFRVWRAARAWISDTTTCPSKPGDRTHRDNAVPGDCGGQHRRANAASQRLVLLVEMTGSISPRMAASIFTQHARRHSPSANRRRTHGAYRRRRLGRAGADAGKRHAFDVGVEARDVQSRLCFTFGDDFRDLATGSRHHRRTSAVARRQRPSSSIDGNAVSAWAEDRLRATSRLSSFLAAARPHCLYPRNVDPPRFAFSDDTGRSDDCDGLDGVHYQPGLRQSVSAARHSR